VNVSGCYVLVVLRGCEQSLDLSCTRVFVWRPRDVHTRMCICSRDERVYVVWATLGVG
jgi:hypothetical protein